MQRSSSSVDGVKNGDMLWWGEALKGATIADATTCSCCVAEREEDATSAKEEESASAGSCQHEVQFLLPEGRKKLLPMEKYICCCGYYWG